jgi:hypothetical protein
MTLNREFFIKRLFLHRVQGPARFDPYSTDSGDFIDRLTAADRPNGDRLSAATSYWRK